MHPALSEKIEAPCNPDDAWEINRLDERLSWGLDVGSGKNKLCPLGCDVRRVADLQCDARFLPFKDKAFVIAVLRHSLEHVKEWPTVLAEAKRVAHYVFVHLPKKEIWRQDPTHVQPFSVEGLRIATYAYGECFLVQGQGVTH